MLWYGMRNVEQVTIDGDIFYLKILRFVVLILLQLCVILGPLPFSALYNFDLFNCELWAMLICAITSFVDQRKLFVVKLVLLVLFSIIKELLT